MKKPKPGDEDMPSVAKPTRVAEKAAVTMQQRCERIAIAIGEKLGISAAASRRRVKVKFLYDAGAISKFRVNVWDENNRHILSSHFAVVQSSDLVSLDPPLPN